jgi:hypothetical protein
MIHDAAGNPFSIRLRYPAYKSGWWIFGSLKYDERDIVLNVLPLKAASYKVLKSVQNDKPQYFYETIIPKQDNTEAGKCSTAVRYPSWPMKDLAHEVNVDFKTTYSEAESTLVGPQVIARGGNNPDGQNDCSASVDAAGKLLVLYEKARGNCDHWEGGVFGGMHWGEGGNEFCRVTAQLQLLKQKPLPIPCPLTGGSTEGDLSWGEEVRLVKDATCVNDIVELSVQLVDYSFNPPQSRTISFIDHTSDLYFSDYVDAIPDDKGFHAWVRSFLDPVPQAGQMVAGAKPLTSVRDVSKGYDIPAGKGGTYPPEPQCVTAGGPAACVQMCTDPIPTDYKVKAVTAALKDKAQADFKPCQPNQECDAGGAALHGSYFLQSLSPSLYEVCWEMRNWATSVRDGRISVQTAP